MIRTAAGSSWPTPSNTRWAIDGFRAAIISAAWIQLERRGWDCTPKTNRSWRPDPLVVIVSLGAPWRLVVNPQRKRDPARHDLELGRGALLVMGGSCLSPLCGPPVSSRDYLQT